MVGALIYSISSLLTILINIPLGIFVFLNDKRAEANRVFVLLMLAISVWALGMFFHVTSNSQITALFWGRFLHFGSLFIPVVFFHFILSLLDLNEKKYWLVRFGYLCALVFFVLNFTDLLVKGVSHKGLFLYLNDVGAFYGAYIVYFMFFFWTGVFFYFQRIFQIESGKTGPNHVCVCCFANWNDWQRHHLFGHLQRGRELALSAYVFSFFLQCGDCLCHHQRRASGHPGCDWQKYDLCAGGDIVDRFVYRFERLANANVVNNDNERFAGSVLGLGGA